MTKPRCHYVLQIDTATRLTSTNSIQCDLEAGHACPHRHNAPRDDDAGRYVILWEGDENFESLDEWEDRLPPSIEELLK